MKLVSIIIPCYKDSATLGRAIESVIHQSYSPIEIIVVNDCSPETELIEACVAKYPQVRYVRNPVNVGLASTRNNGLAIAKGEIVALLDADDECHQDKIARQMEALEDNTVITCGLVNVYPDGRRIEDVKKPRVFTKVSELLYGNKLNGAGLLAPKDLLLRHGGYDPTLRSCEDFDLWLRLLTAGIKVKDIGQPLYFYYFNPAGLSKNIRNISNWELEVIKSHAKRMGYELSGSFYHVSVVFVWLLRHLWRSELANDKELRLQTIANFNLLNGFQIIKLLCCGIAYSRILFMPALLIRCSHSFYKVLDK